jgi:hypothetical protein
VTQNSVKREGLSDTDAKKNGSGNPLELASSEKELPERRSGAFRRKSSPALNVTFNYSLVYMA